MYFISFSFRWLSWLQFCSPRNISFRRQCISAFRHVPPVLSVLFGAVGQDTQRRQSFYSWEIGLGSNFPLYMVIIFPALSTGLWDFSSQLHNWADEHNYSYQTCSRLDNLYLLYCKALQRAQYNGINFGMFYALSGFTAAFSWNLMWFDCMLLLPLVLLGLESLIKEDKGLMYSITLGLTILSNYYIAIMVCISVVFYFLCCLWQCLFLRKNSISSENWLLYNIFTACRCHVRRYTASWALCSRTHSLKRHKLSKDTYPVFSVVTVLNRQLANTEVCIGLEHLPNIYCGVAVFLLYPLYILTGK